MTEQLEGDLGTRARRAFESIPSAHRRWLLVNAVGFSAAANLLVNGGVAWASTIGRVKVPLWGSPADGPSVVIDTSLTLLLLPLVGCPLVTTAVWKERRRGALNALPAWGRSHGLGARLPRRRLARGAAFGVLTVTMVAPPAVIVLVALVPGHVSVTSFVAFKALFATCLGAVVTPVMALLAMADEFEIP